MPEHGKHKNRKTFPARRGKKGKGKKGKRVGRRLGVSFENGGDLTIKQRSGGGKKGGGILIVLFASRHGVKRELSRPKKRRGGKKGKRTQYVSLPLVAAAWAMEQGRRREKRGEKGKGHLSVYFAPLPRNTINRFDQEEGGEKKRKGQGGGDGRGLHQPPNLPSGKKEPKNPQTERGKNPFCSSSLRKENRTPGSVREGL